MEFTLTLSELIIVFGGLVALLITFAIMSRMQKNNVAGLWLIGFCLANVFVIFIKILYSSGYLHELPHLLRWKFPVGLSRPVFFFLFILYLYKGYNKLNKWHLLHFSPVLIVLAYFIPFFIKSAPEKVSWLHGQQYLAHANLPEWYFYFISVYSLFYLTASFIVFLKNRHSTFKLLNNFIFSIFIASVVFIITAIVNTYTGGSATLNNIMYLILSSGFIIVSIIILSSPSGIKLSRNIKYQSSNINKERSIEIYQKARKAAIRLELFKEPDLKLTDLAKIIKEPPYLLSHAINLQTTKSFNDFINQLRIKAAADIISSNSSPHLTLEAIGYEVGFNSRSSFYAAFKKIKKSTPANYKKTFAI